jgi:hypothetical protein
MRVPKVCNIKYKRYHVMETPLHYPLLKVRSTDK